MENFDFYISSNGYLVIPSLDIRYLINFSESNIPSMPEATEASVRAAGRDGDIPLKTTYEPIPFTIVCYTEDNLPIANKRTEELKINRFLNSIKEKTKMLAFEKDNKFYNVKYNGAMVTENYPAFLKFSIPLKSSDSYANKIPQNVITGNGTKNSDTLKEVGALFTINGPASNPIISLNDYSMEYTSNIAEGARIEIDSRKSTITHINSAGIKVNVMKFYNHQFPKIQYGSNELKVLSGINNENQVNVKWYDLTL